MKIIKNNRRKILMCTLILTLLAGTVGINAYLTDADRVTNNISIGINTTEIVEEFTPPESLQPEDSFTKKVQVKNIGSVDCYVRVFCEYSDSDFANLFTLDMNTSDWSSKQSDGYYYYSKILKPGELTQPLFTTVTYHGQDEFKDSLDIIVYEESVQSEGFTNSADAFASIQ